MRDIRIIHPSETEIDVASGAMTRIAGVSKNLTGAEGIHLAVATIPVGCGSDPHIHTNCESAIYILSGQGRFLVGEDLWETLEFGPGDYLYIPAGAPHQPINDGGEPVQMVVARNTPVEIVEPYPARKARAG